MESKTGLRILRLIIFIILTSVAVQHAQASTVHKNAAAATQLDPVLAYSTYLSDFYPSRGLFSRGRSRKRLRGIWGSL